MFYLFKFFRNKLSLKSIYVVLWCIVFSSCGSIQQLQYESQRKTEQSLVLGSIGSDKDFLLQKEYKNIALPTYNKPIKLSVTEVPFNKSVYKVFLKARASQSSNINVMYIDSLKKKPKYIKLQIDDKIEMIATLNAKQNIKIKNYLSLNPYTNIITNLSLVLNKEDRDKLMNAESVFLIEKGLKTYILQLHAHGKKTEQILINKSVVFAYKTSHCCWQENRKHRINIVDLVDEFNNCPNGSYRSSNRAKKKVNYFKL